MPTTILMNVGFVIQPLNKLPSPAKLTPAAAICALMFAAQAPSPDVGLASSTGTVATSSVGRPPAIG